jgi:hypothetical protein
MCTVHVYDIGDKDMKNTAKKTPISIDIEQVVILVCQIGQSERYDIRLNLTVIFLVFLLAFNIAIQYSRWPALQ